MFEQRFIHAFAHLDLSVHDISVAALAAAVITLGVVLLMELRCVLRMRQVVDNQLGRVFEQLDLLRFETQQLLEGQQSLDSRGPPVIVREFSPVPVVAPSAAPARSPESPAAGNETARGMTAGEARLLSSLAQARSRRAEGATA